MNDSIKKYIKYFTIKSWDYALGNLLNQGCLKALSAVIRLEGSNVNNYYNKSNPSSYNPFPIVSLSLPPYLGNLVAAVAYLY